MAGRQGYEGEGVVVVVVVVVVRFDKESRRFGDLVEPGGRCLCLAASCLSVSGVLVTFPTFDVVKGKGKGKGTS